MKIQFSNFLKFELQMYIKHIRADVSVVFSTYINETFGVPCNKLLFFFLRNKNVFTENNFEKKFQIFITFIYSLVVKTSQIHDCFGTIIKPNLMGKTPFITTRQHTHTYQTPRNKCIRTRKQVGSYLKSDNRAANKSLFTFRKTHTAVYNTRTLGHGTRPVAYYVLYIFYAHGRPPPRILHFIRYRIFTEGTILLLFPAVCIAVNYCIVSPPLTTQYYSTPPFHHSVDGTIK